MPSISALSPSGCHLAYAVEHSIAGRGAAVSAEQQRERQQHRSDGGADDDGASPYLAQHQVEIVSGLTASANPIGQTSKERRLFPRSKGKDYKAGNVNTCPVKASVTALQWLDDSHLACGLQDGTVVIIVAGRGGGSRSEAEGAGQQRGRWFESDLGRGGRERWTPALSKCFHRVHHHGGGPEDKSRRVMRIRLSGAGSSGGEGAAAGGATRGSEPTVWVLYPDRVLVCVGVEAIVTLARQQVENRAGSSSPRSPSASGGPTEAATEAEDNHHDDHGPQQTTPGPSFAKLQLEGQGEVLDIVACSAPAGLFEVRPERHSHVILAAGVSPAFAFYPIGSEARSFGLASIAWAVASRVTSLTVGALDGLFGFVGLRGRGRKATAAAKTKGKNRGKASGGSCGGEDGNGGGGGGGDDDGSPAPLALRWDGGLQDGWRRVSRLCLDPSGRLAAAADGFGRVMLVDCATRQVLRMWKGVRDAECGWLEIVESWEGRRVASVGQKSRLTAAAGATAAAVAATPPGEAAATPVIGLYLAILAPLRGRVELWRMRHGPCVRIVPAPAGARLLTSRPGLLGSSVDGVGGKGRRAEALTSCYLLSDGAEEAGGSETTKVKLSPLIVEEDDLADLPSRLSREPTIDDAYRLRKFAAALAEMGRQGSAAAIVQQRRSASAVGERDRLSVGQEAREDALFKLLSELESVESLAQAIASLQGGGRAGGGGGGGGRRQAPSMSLDNAARPDGTIELSASFQRRTSALCRERAEQAASRDPTAVSPNGEKVPTDEPENGKVAAAAAAAAESGATAVAALRFRAAAFELYTVLESVKLNPAGEDEDEDPAFLPPGKRGWKHAALCEEAAGWAGMVRGAEGGRGAPLPSAELPEFEEFLETVAVVLEPVEAGEDVGPSSASSTSESTLGGRGKSPQLLRFTTVDAGDDDDDKRKPSAIAGARSRRTGRDSVSPVEPNQKAAAAAAALEEQDAAARAAREAADHAKRCRARLVGWLFRPLLSDAFALASLTQALSLLGLGGGDGQAAAAVLVGDLAAWFLALPVGRAADTTVGREAQNCPVLRWLKGVILAWASPSPRRPPPPSGWERGGGGGDRGGGEGSFLDGKPAPASVVTGRRISDLFGDPVGGGDASAAAGGAGKGGIFGAEPPSSAVDGENGQQEGEEEEEDGSDGDLEEEEEELVGGDDDEGGGRENLEARAAEILRPMFEACAASQRLENASMLSVVTAEALAACREKLEESSLGQVAIGGGEAWARLARRLRLCLFVDHRLHWGMPAEERDRVSVRQFMEGRASVYALIAKDQLMSFPDLSFGACSARERAEVEASARSQREAAEARAAAAGLPAEQRRRILGSAAAAATDDDGVGNAVAAAPNLADAQMDEQWRTLQAIAQRAADAPKMAALGGTTPALDDAEESPSSRNKPAGRERKASPRGQTVVGGGVTATATEPLPPGSVPETPPTTLFYMRSHAQPFVLACHRTRWLVLSWASSGPAAAEALQRATDPALVVESARVAEAAVRRLSLAVDHLSYLRTAKPFLAGCVAYWLWEHGGVRAHVGSLAGGGGGGSRQDSGGSSSSSGGGGGGETSERTGESGTPRAALIEEGRPAREAFLAAAEEFLKVEALLSRHQDGGDRGTRGGDSGRDVGGRGAGRGPRSEVSFMSLLTEGAMQRCPWPGAWDRWVEECLRDGQVQPPLQPAVAAHSTLLRALRVNTVCGLPEGETLGLFGKGHKLCAEGSLRDPPLLPASTPVRGEGPGRLVGGAGGGSVGMGVAAEGDRQPVARRESYIRRALDAVVPRPAQNVYRLARDFGLSEDTVRGWHCLVLLRRGHDVLGEEALSQIFSLQDLAGDILTVMRLRLKRFLNFLETSPRAPRGLLASLDADTCQWVRSARDTEAAARGTGQGAAQSEKEAGEPLRSTHGVLLCLARALPRESRHKLQANALVTLVGTMLQHFGGGVAGAGGGYLFR